MNKQEWLKVIVQYAKENPQHKRAYLHAEGTGLRANNQEQLANGFVSEPWVTGGRCGGSCFGGKHYPRTPDAENEFTELLDFLEKKTKVTFSQGVRILRSVRTGTYHDLGYYGNYADYAFKYILFSDLADYLASAPSHEKD